jgi:hypothetical protein
MSHTVLVEIVLPVVVVVALALWIFATYRPGDSRRFRASLPGRESGPGDYLHEPDTRELDESGTDYVDFGAPERVRRS